MRIVVTSVYVDDQDRALAFYTDTLGLEVSRKPSAGGWNGTTRPAGLEA